MVWPSRSAAKLLPSGDIFSAEPRHPIGRGKVGAMRAHGALLVTLALALGGCGGDPETVAQRDDSASALSPPAGASPSPTGTPIPTPTPAPATGTVVGTADSEFGEILFDGTGQAIYLFDKEATARRSATTTVPRRGRPCSPKATRSPRATFCGSARRDAADGWHHAGLVCGPSAVLLRQRRRQPGSLSQREGVWRAVARRYASGDPAP